MDENKKQNDNTSEQIGNQDKEENPIVSFIKEKRELYIKEIKRCDDMFIGCKEMITNCKLKGKKEAEAQKFLRKLERYLKDVKIADNDVQMAINDLLDLGAQNEGVKKISAKDINQPERTETSKDTDSISAIDFPQKHSGPKILRFNDKISVLYQHHVYQLVYRFLILHKTITSFMLRQADIVWVIDADSKKKKMTASEFLTLLFPPKLTKKQCLEYIEEVLHENGIDKIPYAGISKELSNWNIYIDSNGKKGAEPIMFYDFYRKKGKKDFKDWVLLRYLPVFKKRKHRTVNLNKARHGEAALKQAAEENFVDPTDEILENIDNPGNEELKELSHLLLKNSEKGLSMTILSNRNTRIIVKNKNKT